MTGKSIEHLCPSCYEMYLKVLHANTNLAETVAELTERLEKLERVSMTMATHRRPPRW